MAWLDPMILVSLLYNCLLEKDQIKHFSPAIIVPIKFTFSLSPLLHSPLTFTPGLAEKPVVTSSPMGGEKTSYTITWQAKTSSQVIRYRLKIRKAKTGPDGEVS